MAYSCSLPKYVSLVITTVREAVDDDILTHPQLNNVYYSRAQSVRGMMVIILLL
jgi:hypothetical protein